MKDGRQSRLFLLFFTMLKIGMFTFGGGYAMIALLEREAVDKRGWLDSDEFLDLCAIAESTPGPIAVNAATYIGYKTNGILGAALSTLAVCIPSFVIVYLISLFFDAFMSIEAVAAAFCGIRVAVVYLIGSAAVRLWRSLEKTPLSISIFIAVALMMIVTTLLCVKLSSVVFILASGIIGCALSLIGQKAGRHK